MDRQEILKLLSTHDLTEDEKEYLYRFESCRRSGTIADR